MFSALQSIYPFVVWAAVSGLAATSSKKEILIVPTAIVSLNAPNTSLDQVSRVPTFH